MKRLSIIAAVVLSACASMQSGDAESAIRRNAAGFATAASHGDVGGMIAFYDDNAVLMPPNAPAFRGKDAIRQFWTGFAAIGAIDASLITDDVLQSGDLAVETGHFELSITPKGAPSPIKDSGKYVVTWHRTHGEWKIVRDIFNSNLAR